jgi:uroporphyrinogen-III decarboxylase
MMTSKQRMLRALNRQTADHLPATTHHLMESFLTRYLHGADNRAFFDRFEMDAIHWVVAHRPDESAGERADPTQEKLGFLEARRVVTDEWRIVAADIPGCEFPTQRFRFITPGGELTMVLQSNEHTSWVTEHLIKQKSDIDLLGEYLPAPKCDTVTVNGEAEAFGERGIVRSHICTFDVFGQPGCWQDASCLVGIERLIMETYDDPDWVHALLQVLQRRKLVYTRSLKGAKYDIIELGGGDASATVISPKIFDEFVAPYDAPVIEAAHEAGQRIVYHTCGGMMPFLERIAAMKPDAMETFTPSGMGADVNLREAKRRIGDKVCMIGGFDQFHFFTGCSPAETRAEVRRCFDEAGAGGGFILCPSDHFFEADLELIAAFADEARRCAYS